MFIYSLTSGLPSVPTIIVDPQVPEGYVVSGSLWGTPPGSQIGNSVVDVSLDDVPDGATITRFCVYGTDLTTSAAAVAVLQSATASAPTPTSHAMTISTTSTTEWCSLPFSLVVDRATRAYMVEIVLQSAPYYLLTAHTVRVEYSP
jgi:hypothetical protein